MYYIKMTPVWLYLFFTYFFTIYAFENSDQGNTSEMNIENQIKNLKEVDTIPLFRKLLGGAPLESVVKSFENFKDLLPKSSDTEKFRNASNLDFYKNLALNPTNFVKSFKGVLDGNPILRKKRNESTSEPTLKSTSESKEDQHLPINRLLDVTDRLFSHTASIGDMLKNQKTDKVTNDIDNNHEQFTRIYEENPDHTEELTENRYAKMLEEIFDTSDNSTPRLLSNDLLQNNHEEEEEEEPMQRGPLAVPKTNKNIEIRTDGPLVSYGLSIIAKIKKIILNLLQKTQGNKQVEGRVFAVSLLASFVLAVSVSATRAFYLGYNICERTCKIITGNSGLTVCNPLSFFTLSRLTKGISDIMSFLGTRFLRIPGFSLSFNNNNNQ